MQKVEREADLPFMANAKHWNVQESGSYTLDCKIGRGHADQLVDLMRRRGNPTLLNSVMRDMVGAGRFGGIEVGFVTRIGQHSMR